MSKERVDLTDCAEGLGDEMYGLVKAMYPICRSITGDGVRESLRIIQRLIPLEIHEIESGTDVFDWTIPKEWNIRDAYILNMAGEKILDFNDTNLHVLNYSAPVNKTVLGKELKEHVITIPEHPDWIPYRTTYYSEKWGFCMAHSQFEQLNDEEEYKVFVDSDLESGHLTYGEYYLKGETEDEVLITCHICHPSLCNDNLSGNALVAQLAKRLATVTTRYSYRFLFIPGTIGSIAWLSQNEDKVQKIRHGLVVVCVGDDAEFTYKLSRQSDAEIDQIVLNVLKNTEGSFKTLEFSPYGYDERQFCSPGFDLHVGSLSRSTHGAFPEYHSSADNLDFVKPRILEASLEKYFLIIDALENNLRYTNLNPKCEPQLGKRGLYGNIGGVNSRPIETMTILWVLNLSDGKHSLLDISERSKIPFHDVKRAAEVLQDADLLAVSDGA